VDGLWKELRDSKNFTGSQEGVLLSTTLSLKKLVIKFAEVFLKEPLLPAIVVVIDRPKFLLFQSIDGCWLGRVTVAFFARSCSALNQATSLRPIQAERLISLSKLIKPVCNGWSLLKQSDCDQQVMGRKVRASVTSHVFSRFSSLPRKTPYIF
jgi:hypothetical protein